MDLKHTAKHIRSLILKSLVEAGSGHTGGSLDLADVFTVLYFNHLKHNPKNPNWEERDRVVLSIGHVAPVLYATLAVSGYFDEAETLTLRKLNSRLQGHPSRDCGLSGIELAAGSLGQGLSVSVGMAIVAKMDSRNNHIYCIMGDGEQQEGSIWEAAMSAAHYKLDNLCAIIDRNRLQIDGKTSDVMEINPLADKWKAFGWNVIEIDGHNHEMIKDAMIQANNFRTKPTVIIANTIMGKGVKSIENDYNWHGKVPTKEQLKAFLAELENES